MDDSAHDELVDDWSYITTCGGWRAMAARRQPRLKQLTPKQSGCNVPADENPMSQTARISGTASDSTAWVHPRVVDFVLLIARVTAGFVFIPHGAQHLFGAFGGTGFSRFVQGLGPVAYLVAIGEFLGGLALIFGVASRFSAASLIVVMGGAIRIHMRNGWFMNWSGRQKGEGSEYRVLMIALLMIILFAGPGRYSLARYLRIPRALS